MIPEIDYRRLIEDCFEQTGAAQGTKGCVQFARGAEWFRSVLLEKTQQTRSDRAAQERYDECRRAVRNLRDAQIDMLLHKVIESHPDPSERRGQKEETLIHHMLDGRLSDQDLAAFIDATKDIL